MANAQDFINEVMPGAIQIQIKYDLPAAAMVAQTAQETGWGDSITKDYQTGKNSFNLFNIKGSGSNGFVTAKTIEYINGVEKTILAQFRAYNSFEESFADYANLITTSSIYKSAVANSSDPVSYLRALQSDGYATDPQYANNIITVMNEYKLITVAEGVLEMALFNQDSAGNIIKEGVVAEWQTQTMQQGLELGLISQAHNPMEVPTISEILAILINAKNKNITL